MTYRLRPKIIVIFLVALVVGLLVLVGKTGTFFTDQFVTSINRQLSSFRRVDNKIYGLPAEVVRVSAYEKAGGVKKISANYASEVWGIVRDYYYDHEKLRFVYETGGDEENRFYFRDGKMIRWLFGPGKVSKNQDEDYLIQEADILLSSRDLFVALAPRLAWRLIEKQSLAEFVPGKTAYAFCEAGEIGHFEPGGKFPVSVAGNVEPNNQVGSWQVGGGALVLSGSFISDGRYEFSFEKKGEDIVARSKPGCILIGPDYKTIMKYVDDEEYYFEIYSDLQLGFGLSLPEEWIGKYEVSYSDTGAIFHFKDGDDSKNWLFDIFWVEKEKWQKKGGEMILFDTTDQLWVGRLRPAEFGRYDGPNKDKFERLLLGVPYIFKTFELK